MLRKHFWTIFLLVSGWVAHIAISFLIPVAFLYAPDLLRTISPLGTFVFVIFSCFSFRYGAKRAETETEVDLVGFIPLGGVFAIGYTIYDQLSKFTSWFQPGMKVEYVLLIVVLPLAISAFTLIYFVFFLELFSGADDKHYAVHGGRKGAFKNLALAVALPISTLWLALSACLLDYSIEKYKFDWFFIAGAGVVLLIATAIGQKHFNLSEAAHERSQLVS